jgi:2-polyprenyl-6-methoxyphenol hydroxylase-like FAD-dependent oxidoreductase
MAALYRQRLAQFGGPVAAHRELIVDDDAVVYRPVENVLVPPPWYRGRVVLIGDAAHATSPHCGQGAAQAIEDAATLASCLTANPADPAAALRRYAELRMPRTARLQEVSHARAHINHLPDGPDQRARDVGFSTTDPLAASAWIYAHDAGAPVTGREPVIRRRGFPAPPAAGSTTGS